MGATIKQVAKLANVSPATVSKYLNGVNLKECNRIAVENAIKQLDFKLNVMAQALRKNKSMTVGILIPELNNIFSTEIISYIENILMKYNYSTIICDYKSDKDLEKQKLNFLLSKMVDALVIMPTYLTKTDIDTIDVPLVCLDRQIDENTSYVVVNNYLSTYNATKHLIKNGHKDIAILCGNEDIYTAKTRLEGYTKALMDNNIIVNNNLIFNGEYSITSGYDMILNLINNKKIKPSAVIATNYELTLGALIALSELSIKIYDDISIIGFDTLDMSMLLNPKLTIVLQPLEKIGNSVADILIDKLVNNNKDNFNIILDTELIINNSVKKI